MSGPKWGPALSPGLLLGSHKHEADSILRGGCPGSGKTGWLGEASGESPAWLIHREKVLFPKGQGLSVADAPCTHPVCPVGPAQLRKMGWEIEKLLPCLQAAWRADASSLLHCCRPLSGHCRGSCADSGMTVRKLPSFPSTSGASLTHKNLSFYCGLQTWSFLSTEPL